MEKKRKQQLIPAWVPLCVYLSVILGMKCLPNSGGKGNGLGLAIVDHMVKTHGATLTVDNQPGEDTTFPIYFPLIEKA